MPKTIRTRRSAKNYSGAKISRQNPGGTLVGVISEVAEVSVEKSAFTSSEKSLYVMFFINDYKTSNMFPFACPVNIENQLTSVERDLGTKNSD